MSLLDLTPDQLLSTTRAVRKRLDLSRPVEPELIRECIELAVQAPTGGNSQQWHFVIVTDAEKRKALADLYRKSFISTYGNASAENAQRSLSQNPERARSQERILSSSQYLAEHLHEVPVHVIPCIKGRYDGLPSNKQAGVWGSILPAVWSFMLAARARGLGTTWTTLHLDYEKEAADVLGISYNDITQSSLIPVAYTLGGTDFKPGPRKPLDKVLHWNAW
ncbi:MAG: nitroreductase family protein [Ktedonobacteraceae bacterium]